MRGTVPRRAEVPALLLIAVALPLLISGCSTGEDTTSESAPSSTTTTTTAAPQPRPLSAVKVGECVSDQEVGAGLINGLKQITVLDCSAPGAVPAVAAGPFKTEFRTQPGASSYQSGMMMFIASDECRLHYGVANPGRKLIYAYPDKATWDAGDHTILCTDPRKASKSF